MLVDSSSLSVIAMLLSEQTRKSPLGHDLGFHLWCLALRYQLCQNGKLVETFQELGSCMTALDCAWVDTAPESG